MIAISWSDFNAYGCPNCGCDFAVGGNVSGGGASFGTCEECKLQFVVLADGMDKSRMGVGTGRKNPDGTPHFEYPVRIDHPRRNVERKHTYEWPDPRPGEPDAEFWTPRGIGYDLSGFVKSKKAGERLLNMVCQVLNNPRPKSWLDYRPSEPKWIQFKFQKEEFNLEALQKAVEAHDNIINMDILKACVIPPLMVGGHWADEGVTEQKGPVVSCI